MPKQTGGCYKCVLNRCEVCTSVLVELMVDGLIVCEAIYCGLEVRNCVVAA